MRRIARLARHGPDRLRHQARRRRALTRITNNRPRRLLCICLGNICRSPYAAAVLRRLLPDADVRSAGFLESGRPSPSVAVSVAASRGVDLSGHRSEQLASETLEWAELVLVMDGSQARRVRRSLGPPDRATLVEVLGDLDPSPIERRVIQDPFGRDEQAFEDVYRRLDACCASVSRGLGSRLGAPGSSLLRARALHGDGEHE